MGHNSAARARTRHARKSTGVGRRLARRTRRLRRKLSHAFVVRQK